MATTLVTNADRMMSSASVLDEGIELTFVDGCSGLIPFSDLPEVAEGGGLENVELPTPYEIVLTTVSGGQSRDPLGLRPPLLRSDLPAANRGSGQARTRESGWGVSESVVRRRV